MGLCLCRLPYLTVEYSATIPVYISLLTVFVFINFGLSTFMDPGAYPKGKLLSNFMLHLHFIWLLRYVQGAMWFNVFDVCFVLTDMILLSFSALMLLVGRQEEHAACKNWVVRYWHGYLSGAMCKWFASCPADATATLSSLAPVKSRMVYLSGAGLPRLSWKKGIKWM